MSLYDELQGVAKSLLKEFKQGTVKLVQVTPGAGPADNPGTATETSYELDATVKGVSRKYLNTSFIVASDLEVTSAVIDDVTPNEKDFIVIDDVRHKIVQDLSTPAAGAKVVWKFIVRRGG